MAAKPNKLFSAAYHEIFRRLCGYSFQISSRRLNSAVWGLTGSEIISTSINQSINYSVCLSVRLFDRLLIRPSVHTSSHQSISQTHLESPICRKEIRGARWHMLNVSPLVYLTRCHKAQFRTCQHTWHAILLRQFCPSISRSQFIVSKQLYVLSNFFHHPF